MGKIEGIEKHICKYCKKEIISDWYTYMNHVKECDSNPNKEKQKIESKKKSKITRDKNWKEKHGELKKFTVRCHICNKEFTVEEYEKDFPKKNKYFCSRSCANTRHPSKETKNKISNSVKTSEKAKEAIKKRYNLSKTNEQKIYIPKYSTCEICGKTFEQSHRYIQRKNIYVYGYAKTCSKECKSKLLSQISKEHHTGGFKENSVKNYKSGWYKGIHCDSSWELAFVIYCLEHNLNIKRCTEKRKYIYENKECLYYPDFEIDGTIYEIKGINSDNWQAKLKYNSDVIPLYKNDMKKYLDYVINKYGKDFTSLYEIKDKA